MANELTIECHLKAPKNWDASIHNSFFDSSAWTNILQSSFKTEFLYLVINQQFSLLMPIFKVGPFSIGYLGFPVLDVPKKDLLLESIIEKLKTQSLPIKIDLIKSAVSAFGYNDLPKSVNLTPETEIENIEEWDITKLPKNTRRDITHAQNQQITLQRAQETSYDDAIFTFYKKTIDQRGGAAKYNAEYFQALFTEAQTSDNILFLCAYHESQCVGFAVFIKHNTTAYYAHGAVSSEHKSKGISDLLIYEGIAWAKEKGLKRFNLMASPSDQKGLIRYKEKWGSVTQNQSIYEWPIRPIKAALFKSTLAIYNCFQRIL